MRLLLALTLAGLVCGLAAPQAPAGGAARLSLSGRVRSSGLAIPGATITATQGANRGVTTTDEDGRYQFADLAPGDWAIKVEMLGFSASERRVAVSNEPASADFDLTLLAAGACAGAGSGAPRRIPERESQRSRRKHDGGGERRAGAGRARGDRSRQRQ